MGMDQRWKCFLKSLPGPNFNCSGPNYISHLLILVSKY